MRPHRTGRPVLQGSGGGRCVPDAMQTTPTMDVFHYDPVIPEPYVAVWEGSFDVERDGNSPVPGERIRAGEAVPRRLSDRAVAAWVGAGVGGVAVHPVRRARHPRRVPVRIRRRRRSEVLWAPPDAALQTDPGRAANPVTGVDVEGGGVEGVRQIKVSGPYAHTS